MEYYKVRLYKFYQQNEETSIDFIDTIIVGKGLNFPTKEEIKNDTFRVKEIMTNLVIKCLPTSYCFEEGI